MNLLGPILAEISSRPDRTAIIAGDGNQASYGGLITQSERLAAAWKDRGLEAGDRVLVAMPVGIPLYASLVALWRLGAVAVFPEPALGLAGLRHAIRATRPRAYLADGWFRLLRYALPDLWPVALALTPRDEGGGSLTYIEEVTADHPALISFTSGSTGRPKAILRSHHFLSVQNSRIAELLTPQREGSIDLVGFPVFVLANLGLGVTSVLPNWSLRRQEAADAAHIAQHLARNRVNRALIPPSICEKLTGGPKLPLDAIFTGGGPVFPDLLSRLSSHFPGTAIVSVYGSTEAEPIAHQSLDGVTEADWTAMRQGAGLLAGPPIPQIALKILDDEIVVSGAHVNQGYLDSRDDQGTKLRIDGTIWHRTGDAGRLDGQGRLWLMGRKNGVTGGLYPFGIEAAARFWPGVRQAALTGLDGKPVLAIAGDEARRTEWQSQADCLAGIRVVVVGTVPLDRRHGSKVDYPALEGMIRRG